MVIVGCQRGDESPTPIYVTEIFRFDDGREVVLTLEVTATPDPQTPTPEPTIFIPPSPVELDVATVFGFGILDPQTVGGGLTRTLVDNLYAGLMRVNADGSGLVPELAALPPVPTEGGRIWTFELRDDVYWVRASLPAVAGLSELGLGDGVDVNAVEFEQIRPIIADDFVLAIQRACGRDTDTPDVFVLFLVEGCEQLYSTAEPTEQQLLTLGVRAISDSKLEIRLTKPAAYFLSMVTLPAFRPIPSDIFLDEEVNWLAEETFVTSGPFVLSPYSDPEAQPNPVTILQRNPHWPTALLPAREGDDEAFDILDRVNIYRYDSLTDAYQDYEADLIDITFAPSSIIDIITEPPAKPPPLVNSGNVFYVAFNFDTPAFALPEVRRAFSAAINREQLIEEVYGQAGWPMKHLTPPDVIGAPPIDEVGVGLAEEYAFRELLNSGYGACQRIGPINYLINATDDALRHAETLIVMWTSDRNLGCDVNQFVIEQVPFGELLARTDPDYDGVRPDMWDLGWVSLYPDAYGWYEAVLHCERGLNRPKRPCSEVDQLIDQAAITIDDDQRATLYRQIETALFNESGWTPIIPLYLEGRYQLEQDWIQHVADDLRSDAQVIRRSIPYFDNWGINQSLKDLERSQ